MEAIDSEISKNQNAISRHFPLVALIAANLIPLTGVIFGHWDIFSILFVYWLESGVVGFFNILKLVKINYRMSFVLVPFFCIHYAGFMAGHLFFIFLFFHGGLPSSLSEFLTIFTASLLTVALTIVSLIISHGISFFQNFLGKREFEKTNIGAQMFSPYKRIILMQCTLLVGGFSALFFHKTTGAISAMVLIKIAADIYVHLHEHTLQKSEALPFAIPFSSGLGSWFLGKDDFLERKEKIEKIIAMHEIEKGDEEK